MNSPRSFAGCTRSRAGYRDTQIKRKKRESREPRPVAVRERAQSQWSSDRLVGVGRLVWPTGADTRRKHARRNVARFVASGTYWYTCTGHVYGGELACTYARVSYRVSAPTVRRGRAGRVGGAKNAEHGPKGNCAPLAGTVHGAVIATIFRVYRICIRECRA